MDAAESVYEVALQAAPWLVLGLVVAGLIHSFLPPARVTRWLGGGGLGSILKAALLGAPLPLCSCGVLPVAVGLRRAGASRGATASFMVSTPETGVDSISLTYAMMGPVYAVTRPVSAVVSAIVTGLLVEWFGGEREKKAGDVALPLADEVAACCRSGEHDHPEDAPERRSFSVRLREGQVYAATRLIDDLAKWLVIGIVVSGLMNAFIEPSALERWGSGPWAYAVMLVIGLPLYVCASAATPVAASLLMAGVSPGPVLVLLLAGPATNVATLGVLRRELGVRSIAPYFAGVGGVAVLAGLMLDAMAARGAAVMGEHVGHGHGMLPRWLAVACLAWLVLIAVRPLRGLVFGVVGRRGVEKEADCCASAPATEEKKACCAEGR